MDNELNVNRAELLDILEHFEGKQVTNEVLQEYCTRKKYRVITEGELEDWRFQYEHDKWLNTILPEIFKILAKYQNVPEMAGENKRKELRIANEELEIELCDLLETYGILYQEIDLVFRNLGGILKALLDNAATRANNMCATMFAHTAKEHYGDPLTVKALGEAYRAIATKLDSNSEQE